MNPPIWYITSEQDRQTDRQADGAKFDSGEVFMGLYLSLTPTCNDDDVRSTWSGLLLVHVLVR